MDPNVHASYVVVRVLQKALYGEVVLVRNPEGQLLVQKRLLCENIQRRQQVGSRTGATLAEDPQKECQVYDAVQARGGHPHILRKVNHYVTGDNLLFVITLEFADGGEYFDALQNEVYPYQTLRAHFVRITNAMQFLHRSGWTNLDLSAENILVKDQNPLLMDFGMALMTTERAQGFRGKEFYAAPELWMGAPCDPALADLWSLGVLLFIMLTRCPPFERASRSCNRFKYVASRPENGLQRMIAKFNLTEQFADGSLDLVQRLLRVDPRARASLEDVLAHPFCA